MVFAGFLRQPQFQEISPMVGHRQQRFAPLRRRLGHGFPDHRPQLIPTLFAGSGRGHGDTRKPGANKFQRRRNNFQTGKGIPGQIDL